MLYQDFSPTMLLRTTISSFLIYMSISKQLLCLALGIICFEWGSLNPNTDMSIDNSNNIWFPEHVRLCGLWGIQHVDATWVLANSVFMLKVVPLMPSLMEPWLFIAQEISRQPWITMAYNIWQYWWGDASRILVLPFIYTFTVEEDGSI